jgi:hypothetical protein
MFGSCKPAARRLASFGIVLTLLALALADRASAQAVTNGDFRIPNVASAPNGLLGVGAPALVNTPGVGWRFPFGGYLQSGITAVQVTSGSGLDAPPAPDSSQVGFISSYGQIDQLLTLGPGDYTLSFKLAQAKNANPAIPVAVYMSDQQLGLFSPTSTTSYKAFTVSFSIGTPGANLLRFVGQAGNSLGMTFIDAVSITQAPPVITGGPTDIDPTSKISLQGRNFSLPLQVSVDFTNPSGTPPFEMVLNVPPGQAGAELKAITTQAIDATYPTGKQNQQSVDIIVATPYAKLSSNVWHATFHPKAVITSGPATITPGQKFNLRGWDFDSKEQCASHNANDRGTVTIHFNDKSVLKFPNQGNNASDRDLVIQIPIDGCQDDLIRVQVPKATAGVIEQPVEITYESPHGRKSNVWKATFKPTMTMEVISTVVAQCSNQTSLDLCNPGPGSYSGGGATCSGLDTIGGPITTDNSILGYHVSCAVFSSDNGQDLYTASVTGPWMITQVVDVEDIPPLVAGAWGTVAPDTTMEFDYVPQPLPHGGTITVNVNWHIGTGGNVLYYAFNVWAKGPAGVPAQ